MGDGYFIEPQQFECHRAAIPSQDSPSRPCEQNFPSLRAKLSVPASGARQSITAHLQDGWPRCARHDTTFVSALAMTPRRLCERSAAVHLRAPPRWMAAHRHDGWPRCARHDAFFVTASEARQSISAHLDDGWPRCARHDAFPSLRAKRGSPSPRTSKMDVHAALAMTLQWMAALRCVLTGVVSRSR